MTDFTDTEILDWLEDNLETFALGIGLLVHITWIGNEGTEAIEGYGLRDCATKAMQQEGE